MKKAANTILVLTLTLVTGCTSQHSNSEPTGKVPATPLNDQNNAKVAERKVNVKYRGFVDLGKFGCSAVRDSSVVREICYLS